MKPANINSSFKPDFLILDGLRGIAAVYVVLFHSRGDLLLRGGDYSKIVPVSQWSLSTKIYYSLLQFTTLGREFVIFFFVLSGFSIAYSLSNNSEVLPFYKRRLVRLYPTYLLALVWAAAIFAIVTTIAPAQLDAGERSVFDTPLYVIRNFFYLHSGGDLTAQFWSLILEVIFYILIPLFFLLGLRYYIVLSVVGYLAGWFLKWNGVSGDNIISIFFFDYNIFFAVGILLFQHFDKVRKLLHFRKVIFYLISIGLFICMIVIKLKLGEANKVTTLLSAVLAILMIVNFLHHEIKNEPLLFFGKMSYTIYTTHIASLYLFIALISWLGLQNQHHSQITIWYIWPLGVVFSLMMALPLYYMGEYPSKILLSKLRKKR